MKICFFIIVFIIATIYPFSPLNKWLLHNKWNHSDWATFLAGFLGFCGSFIALYGIKLQFKKEINEKKSNLKNYLKYIIKCNKKAKVYDSYKFFNLMIYSYNKKNYSVKTQFLEEFKKLDLKYLEENYPLLCDLKISDKIFKIETAIRKCDESYNYMKENFYRINESVEKLKVFISESNMKEYQKEETQYYINIRDFLSECLFFKVITGSYNKDTLKMKLKSGYKIPGIEILFKENLTDQKELNLIVDYILELNELINYNIFNFIKEVKDINFYFLTYNDCQKNFKENFKIIYEELDEIEKLI